ncbi:four helix bundle suffix domain-containing protein [uncultured Duncaniella sp.]|uniref:four helix bundle suffix domain-containing protein n=1 Tax=uncultured Duncaniella sp. TaxID=2768039 RepID=UPI0026033CA4|nr:four helix bundle suffix domain-containing protein [uncultured Duncaniella sp.]
MARFLKISGDFSRWNIYRKAACVCDVTEMFIRRAFPDKTRTIDQMRQAARSCKQNIVEGVTDCTVSMEMGIKLVGIARGSLRELMEDYIDFLYQNDLSVWKLEDQVTIRARDFCRQCDDRVEFKAKCKDCSGESVANIMITEIRQLDAMIASLLETMEQQFLSEGGLKESMYKARIEWRKINLGF